MAVEAEPTQIDTPTYRRFRDTRWPLLVIAVIGVGLLAGIAGYKHWSNGYYYVRTQTTWQSFQVSSDRRTLTFLPWGAGDCDEPATIAFQGDPVDDATVKATAYYRHKVQKGQPFTCDASLGMPGKPISVTLRHPVNPHLLIVDGAPPDPFFCSHPMRQRVEEGMPANFEPGAFPFTTHC